MPKGGATLSEHDYRIKGLPGLVFSFSEANRANLCILWNRVQTGIEDVRSISTNQLPSVEKRGVGEFQYQYPSD